MYAVVETGGKQYRVAPGERIIVERLAGNPGDPVTFDRVLLVVNDSNVQVGQPLVEGAQVKGTIVRQGRTRKIIVYKYKAKQRYRRKRGHRQYFTEVLIDDIVREANA